MKKRQHIESDFQTDFKPWVTHCFNETAVIELKVTPTNSINFKRLESHQFSSLWNAKHRKQYYRIKDTDFLFKRPYDCYVMCGVSAYIAVMFRNEDWGQKEFFLIDIYDWESESKISTSLTEERAREIGKQCLLK